MQKVGVPQINEKGGHQAPQKQPNKIPEEIGSPIQLGELQFTN